MRISIVISFDKDNLVRIEKVFSTRTAANECAARLEMRLPLMPFKSYHVLTKSVNGMLSTGIPSKGRIKMLFMTINHYELQSKIDNQKDYIQKLEKRIQQLKTEINSSLNSSLNEDSDYESQANDNYGNRVVKQKDGHIYLANGDVWENSDFDEYRPKGNFNIQD